MAGELLRGLRGELAVMLRITVCDESETTRIVVEGKLAGATVSELEKSWHTTLSGHSRVGVIVDLTCVSFVDTSGKVLLKQMHESGIKFVGIGIMPKCLIEEIESTDRVMKRRDGNG